MPIPPQTDVRTVSHPNYRVVFCSAEEHQVVIGSWTKGGIEAERWKLKVACWETTQTLYYFAKEAQPTQS